MLLGPVRPDERDTLVYALLILRDKYHSILQRYPTSAPGYEDTVTQIFKMDDLLTRIMTKAQRKLNPPLTLR